MDINIIKECNRLAADGKITFPEVVEKFMAAGIERYHIDFVWGSNIYYWPNGDVHVEPAHKFNVAENLDKQKIAATVAEIQQGKINYTQFVEKITTAGCSHYYAALTGKRVIYSGRNGDSHTEFFPGSK